MGINQNVTKKIPMLHVCDGYVKYDGAEVVD